MSDEHDEQTQPPADAPPEKVELPEGCVLNYVVQADKKVLPTDSVVVEVSAPESAELVPDTTPIPGTAASGKVIGLAKPATGVTLKAMLTHAGGEVLNASATFDVVLPDPATKITVGLGKPHKPLDPNAPAKGTPRNPN